MKNNFSKKAITTAMALTFVFGAVGCGMTGSESDATVINIANYGGGVGRVWLDNAITRFQAKVKDTEYEPGSGGFDETSPIQPTERLPKEFEGIPNKHNGTHHFLIDDFCTAFATGKLSPTNIWAVARYNLPGLVAHKSAMAGGVLMEVPDLGDPPADWEVLDYRTME